MPQIPYPELNEVAPDVKEFYENMPVKLNMAKMACHSSALVKPFLKLGSAILLKSKTPATLRELLILRIAAITNSHYELYHHEHIAKQTGIDDSYIKVAQDKSTKNYEALPEDIKVVFKVADDVIGIGRISSQVMDELKRLFSNEIVVELSIISGYYTMVSQYLQSLDINTEDDRIANRISS